jgi:DNA-binding transcriptional ArsR family regulator
MAEHGRSSRSAATPLVPPKPASAAVAAKFFRGLGDPTRVRILQMLVDGERTVGELVDEVGGLQGRVSSHLACLRWCGFVTTRREGRSVYYRLADDRVPELLRLAEEFLTHNAAAVDLCRVIDGES